MIAKNSYLRRMLEKNTWEEYLRRILEKNTWDECFEIFLRTLLKTLVADGSWQYCCQQSFKNHLLKIIVKNNLWNECVRKFSKNTTWEDCWQWLLEMFLRRVIEEMWFRQFSKALLPTIIQKSSSENQCQQYLSEMNTFKSFLRRMLENVAIRVS